MDVGVAEVRVDGPNPSVVRFHPKGAGYTAREYRWIVTQMQRGTTREKIARDFAKRFPNHPNVKAGKRAIGNRTFMRIRSKHRSALFLAGSISRNAKQSTIEYWQKRAAVYTDAKTSRTLVQGEILDPGGNRFRNFYARNDQVTPRNVADTIADLSQDSAILGTPDSRPLDDPIDDPIEELDNRIIVNYVTVLEGLG